LYSGTFNFYDNIKFIESTTAPQVQELNTQTSEVSTQTTQTQTTESDWPKAGKTVIIYTKYRGSTTSATSATSITLATSIK
jgi:hypothetical protein